MANSVLNRLGTGAIECHSGDEASTALPSPLPPASLPISVVSGSEIILFREKMLHRERPIRAGYFRFWPGPAPRQPDGSVIHRVDGSSDRRGRSMSASCRTVHALIAPIGDRNRHIADLSGRVFISRGGSTTAVGGRRPAWSL